MGEDPALWDWCRVAVYSKEDINNLSIKRLKNIKERFNKSVFGQVTTCRGESRG